MRSLIAMNLPYGYLYDALSKTSDPIKTTLTPGDVVRGIGNAYVDEILYEAKISPFSKANKIPKKHVDKLVSAIHSVLVEAENTIVAAFPDTITEKKRDFLKVHLPKKKVNPAGESILAAVIDGRKTYYTAAQVLFE